MHVYKLCIIISLCVGGAALLQRATPLSGPDIQTAIMSSVVSLRSYQKRRKSAGARLEGAYASTPGSIPAIIPPGHPPGTAPEGMKHLPPFREKRVKSARETRQEQEASDIFPELQKSRVDPEWGKTKYSEDFCLKKVTPVEIRPISPTRMNNPHPSKVREIQWWRA